MAELSGPYSRLIAAIDRLADVLTGEDNIDDSTGNRMADRVEQIADFFESEGTGKYRNVQADWNADPDSEAAILNKPAGIAVDPSYVHTDENFTLAHRNKLENIEALAQVNVQPDWAETDPESDAFIRNVPGDIVQDADYVHTDNNFTDEHKDKLENHVITDDYYTPEDSEKLESIEWNATHTDVDSEITPESTNPVESAAIHAALETKVDKVEGYALSKNDFTDELKAKLDAIEEGSNKTIVDDALSSESTNPVENRVVQAALDTKVDKEEGKGLSDENYTRAEKLKLEGIEEQANRTIPDDSITATSHNVVKSKAIYEALDTKVNKVNGKGLSANDFTDAEKTKLAGIEANATNTIIEPSISNVSENPVRSRAIYDALQGKVDKVEGKELSDNNFTDEEKVKLSRFNPEAPKITIARLIMDQASGEPAGINLTWQQCKDAISNGVLYYQRTTGDSETISLCYSVESELKNGAVVYRAEFADFNTGIYEYFEASSADSNPSFIAAADFQPDMSVKVDKTTTINGHALDRDVTITPSDIAYAHTEEYQAGSVGAALNYLRQNKADKATHINGHTLENDVTLSPEDIGLGIATENDITGLFE